MTVLIHLLLFLLSAASIWFLTGHLIESVDRVARRLRKSEFTVALFVLLVHPQSRDYQRIWFK